MSEQREAGRSERHSGIELLRMLAGMGVIILHFNFSPAGDGALTTAGGFNAVFLLLLENLCISAVNIFILISGYFGCSSTKTKPGKLILILLQTIAVNLVINIVRCILAGKVDFRSLLGSFLPVNYYVILYCSLMLVAPFINKMLKNLTDSALFRLLVIAFVLFSVCACGVEMLQEITGGKYAGLNPVGIDGSSAGYTIVNFILVYLIGAGLKRVGERTKKLSVLSLALIVAVSVAVLYIWRMVLPGTSWMYNNPVVIIQAAALFLLFERMTFRNRVINRVAPAAFTCFLIHEVILNRVNPSLIGTKPFPVMLGILAGSVIGIYAVSYLVMLLWNWITGKIFGEKLDRIPVISA